MNTLHVDEKSVTTEDIMGFGIPREIISPHLRGTGLWSVLPRQPVLVWDDSFSRVVRDSDDIHMDEVILKRGQNDHDKLLSMAEWLRIEIEPEKMTGQEVLNITTMYHMINLGIGIEHTLSRMLWDGNPSIKRGDYYREFKGLELSLNGGIHLDSLITDESIEYVMVGPPSLLYHLGLEGKDTYEADGRSFQLIWDSNILPSDISDDDRQFTSSLYAIPISQGDEKLTYIEYVDYGHILDPSVVEWDTFWTDGGMYVWRVLREKWDFKLVVKNESRLIVKRPDLVIKFDTTYTLPEGDVMKELDYL